MRREAELARAAKATREAQTRKEAQMTRSQFFEGISRAPIRFEGILYGPDRHTLPLIRKARDLMPDGDLAVMPVWGVAATRELADHEV